MKPTDACRCDKPPGNWGNCGWHFRPHPDYPNHPQVGIAYERCPAYEARRNESAERDEREEQSR